MTKGSGAAANYIAVSISCESVDIDIGSDDLTFEELQDKFFEIYEKLPVNGKPDTREVMIQ